MSWPEVIFYSIAIICVTLVFLVKMMVDEKKDEDE